MEEKSIYIKLKANLSSYNVKFQKYQGTILNLQIKQVSTKKILKALVGADCKKLIDEILNKIFYRSLLSYIFIRYIIDFLEFAGACLNLNKCFIYIYIH